MDSEAQIAEDAAEKIQNEKYELQKEKNKLGKNNKVAKKTLQIQNLNNF